MQEVYVKDLPTFINEAFTRLFRYVSTEQITIAGHSMVILHSGLEGHLGNRRPRFREQGDEVTGPVRLLLRAD